MSRDFPLALAGIAGVMFALILAATGYWWLGGLGAAGMLAWGLVDSRRRRW